MSAFIAAQQENASFYAREGAELEVHKSTQVETGVSAVPVTSTCAIPPKVASPLLKARVELRAEAEARRRREVDSVAKSVDVKRELLYGTSSRRAPAVKKPQVTLDSERSARESLVFVSVVLTYTCCRSR